ncbi:MAG: hypothetical protein JNK89_00205 [Saprospiraceae bacterium]|nr:hypothetical protein [Saprospiraceae bacterium]
MKNLFRIGYLALFWCAGQTACTPDKNLLVGHWQAVAFYENGKTHQAPLDAVALDLDANGGYQFRSQGQYLESGAYRLNAAYLFLRDTTAQPAQEHRLKVLHVSADSLKIEMRQGDAVQVLFFARLSHKVH